MFIEYQDYLQMMIYFPSFSNKGRKQKETEKER